MALTVFIRWIAVIGCFISFAYFVCGMPTWSVDCGLLFLLLLYHGVRSFVLFWFGFHYVVREM